MACQLQGLAVPAKGWSEILRRLPVQRRTRKLSLLLYHDLEDSCLNGDSVHVDTYLRRILERKRGAGNVTLSLWRLMRYDNWRTSYVCIRTLKLLARLPPYFPVQS
ncbi:hypothetical protein VTI28DRAFT_4726 [Corynascus sepedonium]